VSGAGALAGPPSLLSGETSRRTRPDEGRGRAANPGRVDVAENGAEVHSSYTNTEAIARWALGGFLLGGVCIALMILLVIGTLKRGVT
jgi:hypothetical protein